MDINKYNCLEKLLRISAYVLKFMRKMKLLLRKKEEEDTTVNNNNNNNNRYQKREKDTISKCWLGAEELLEA